MQELISPPQTETAVILESLYKNIRSVVTLHEKHLRALPRSIEELSQLLTQNRADIPFYWTSPAMLSAYFYYFLPWNLVRLAQILPNLDLPSIEAFKKNPIIVDMGSGSLTIPIALWLFRKELRDIPLTIYCIDTAKKPMEYGRLLLERIMGNKAWKIVLLDGRNASIINTIKGKISLSVVANACNELVQKSPHRTDEIVARLFKNMTQALSPEGQFLCIEVGNRLGGKIISTLRQHIVENTPFAILAPCTHRKTCPYMEEKATAWCHFRFADFSAPKWLIKLTEKANLSKTTLSISLLHVGIQAKQYPNSRVLSGLIHLAESKERVRYVCKEEGLMVLEKAENIVQGTAVDTIESSPKRIDAKSKMPFVRVKNI